MKTLSDIIPTRPQKVAVTGETRRIRVEIQPADPKNPVFIASAMKGRADRISKSIYE